MVIIAIENEMLEIAHRAYIVHINPQFIEKKMFVLSYSQRCRSLNSSEIQMTHLWQ